MYDISTVYIFKDIVNDKLSLETTNSMRKVRLLNQYAY